MELQFKASREDYDIIAQIADRAQTFYKAEGIKRKTMDIQLDMVVTHCNGNPLKLRALLEADEFNFMHDVGGIAKHLDRKTGKLLDCFSPRFSRREEA